MSRHEGVSCDFCLKRNFRGKRFKCLVCFNYDLCATCYETGASTVRHSVEHPMQCILTRNDFDLYYGGEAVSGECQAYTCPYCGHMGFTEQTLIGHVNAEHSEQNSQVLCPICASVSEGVPNLITHDFTGHLSLEHCNPVRDIISFLEEPSRPTVHRIPTVSPRGMPSSRSNLPSRPNVHFRFPNGSTRTFASVSSSFESVDPISDFISQLSGVSRSEPGENRQLQRMQERVQAVTSQMERGGLLRRPRRQVNASSNGIAAQSNSEQKKENEKPAEDSTHQMVYKLLKPYKSDTQPDQDSNSGDKSFFVQDLMLGSLKDNFDHSVVSSFSPKINESESKWKPDTTVLTVANSKTKGLSFIRSPSSSLFSQNDDRPQSSSLILDSPLKFFLKKRGS